MYGSGSSLAVYAPLGMAAGPAGPAEIIIVDRYLAPQTRYLAPQTKVAQRIGWRA